VSSGVSDGGVLLLGASGFLGPVLAAELGTRLAGRTYASRPVTGGLKFDVCGSYVADLVSQLPEVPSAAVILLGETNIDACARDPAGTAAINVRGIVRVVDELRALGIAPLFTSSDAVFDGSRAFWRENDAVTPILTYGRQKLSVEHHIASQRPPGLIVRLPKLLSALRNERCVLTGWIDALGRDETILCATDQYFTPADAGEVAKVIIALAAAGETGLYHLGGPERLSRRELLQAVVDEYRRHARPRARIKECLLRDIPVVEARPLDLSMDSSRLRARLGGVLRPASEIARLAVRDHFGVTRRPS
jgi:dTDP-4-dehydrorhamnose reductase